jgi:hypothetical protein
MSFVRTWSRSKIRMLAFAILIAGLVASITLRDTSTRRAVRLSRSLWVGISVERSLLTLIVARVSGSQPDRAMPVLSWIFNTVPSGLPPSLDHLNSDSSFLWGHGSHCVVNGQAVQQVLLRFPLLAIAILPVGCIAVQSAVHEWRRRQRGRMCRCEACGYSLVGNVSGVCPECGCATKSLGREECDTGP